MSVLPCAALRVCSLSKEVTRMLHTTCSIYNTGMKRHGRTANWCWSSRRFAPRPPRKHQGAIKRAIKGILQLLFIFQPR